MVDRQIKIVLLDNHTLERAGYASLLASCQDLEVVGEANFEDAARVVELNQPDVVLIDLRYCGQDYRQNLILNILQNSPETHILLVANTAEDKHVMGAFRQGATGCLLANSPVEELYQSIRSLAEGGSYLPPMVGLKLIQKYNHTDRLKPQNPPILSTQQILVLRYISNGLTNQEIADILVISKRTVEMHVYKIFKKLKVSNRTQAIQAGLREGIIDVYDIPAVSESIPLDSKNWD